MSDKTPTIDERSGAEPPAQADQLLEPLPSMGRFRFDRLVGEGGMGRVYKAYDSNLQRWVAIKLLRSNDPVMLARFVREARAQARVKHDHVCPVYQVEEEDGIPFIVMALIDGVTLREGADDMSLEDTVAVFIDAAEALHAGHTTGLIHRDIKPSNIMVEPSSQN
ncbi:MAG: serine/threonine protein kinase, partial [Thermoanaerobaculales bacterium]|nr:serine/threonine protein kinase [Thermoanaerobaculales bacterium]